MALPQHLDDAAARLRVAAARLKEVRQSKTDRPEAREWLEALTDYVLALSDIQSFNNESVHEKLHALADRMGLREFPTARGKGGG
jgi:hypothetical protein